jgi:hypothetical protein
MKNARFADTLRVLVRHEVEFIVVGMAAGVLQGVPLTTLDVDIVHQRTPDNVARFDGGARRASSDLSRRSEQAVPGASHLTGPGHQLLTTDHGDLDCLGAVDDGKSYEDLLPLTNEIEIGGGAKIKVLEL